MKFLKKKESLRMCKKYGLPSGVVLVKERNSICAVSEDIKKISLNELRIKKVGFELDAERR